jgi:signal transduction histidine kinase
MFFTRQQFLIQATIGFVFGFFFLHPLSMIIFHFLDPLYGNGMSHPANSPVWKPILYSFYSDMLPMGIVFGLVGTIITVAGTYHRRLIVEQNEKLVQLERANRRQTQFMVHDFKTSLACIIGFSNLLLKKDAFEPNSEFQLGLERIRRQACRMQNIVNDLLDFAKLQNVSVIKKEQLNVTDLITESIRDFSLPEHKNALSVGENNTSCPPAWGNMALLHRILVNLISNALKHNPPGTAIQIDAEYDPRKRKILFSCFDDGLGIPRESLPTLFDEFISEQRFTDSDSTGLGLAFCKAAVEAHGGRIWCESEENQGTRFYFTLATKEEIFHEC